MLIRIYKRLQEAGTKLIVLFNSHLLIYYLFHTSLLLSFSMVPPQSQDHLSSLSEGTGQI